MQIGSIKETIQIEKRIAITPEIAKKYVDLGLEVALPENYGLHLGYSDDLYKKNGTNIIKDEKELINSCDVILQLNLPADDKISLLKEKQTLIGILNPYENKNKIDNLSKKKKLIFFL